ncbi:MAG: hypothetical protein HYV35_06750 [Lentisphaerae bacterium]|nr:hypothetical protein [Lentisphaerota bacterium]
MKTRGKGRSAWGARVVAEETLHTYADPKNGAGAMWCFGSRTIVRRGAAVYAVVPETGAGIKPLCNTRWVLYSRRDGDCWKRAQAAPEFLEREPCPLALLPGGRLILSTNPKTAVRGERNAQWEAADTDPSLLWFETRAPQRPPRIERPVWREPFAFFEHSYRGLAVEPKSGALLMTQQVADGDGYSQAWTYRNAAGRWTRQGVLRFPVRGCYPMIALRGKMAAVVAVSDIVEPNPLWRRIKREATGQEWDFDFRQLFFTWTPDITSQPFSPPLTFASRDETCGLLHHLDVWLDAGGDAHVLYGDRNCWQRCIRNRCFPGLPIVQSLEYCRIHQGAVVERRTLLRAVESPATVGAPPVRRRGAFRPVKWDTGKKSKGSDATDLVSLDPIPMGGVLHATPVGELYVLISMRRARGRGKPVVTMGMRRLLPDDTGAFRRVPMQNPLHVFFNACERAGTRPSHTLDLYGHDADPLTIRYAQLRIEP